ncbi:MAG: type II toxin-antitoxin system HipA family toxin [Deltaproteobacteria bacterium]|nr:type II toxin-antitoxin system HipA family toxin [Candidatus Tharpella aukensis]
MSDASKIFVDINIDGIDHFVGTMWYSIRKNRGFSSFQYSEEWQANPEAFSIDPAISPLHSKEVFRSGNKALFGCFEDAAPDRWGRMLIRRTFNDAAKASGKHPRSLTDIDFLLMVDDLSRMGAFRFRIDKEYLAVPTANSIPPMIRLRELLQASEKVEERPEARNLLLAPGSSLGGARPKACLLSPDRTLNIAKFESSKDEYDVVLWEAVVLHLASECGLNVPYFQIENISVSKTDRKTVLLEKRFDRAGASRIPYISTMTLLNASDNNSEDYSYLHISEKLSEISSQPTKDLRELWMRIVLGILISNTDNHLRNHGLIRTSAGWRLSPLFDINPNPENRIFSLSIDLEGNNDIKTALEVAEYFEVPKTKAKEIIKSISIALQNWKHTARKYGCTTSEISRMEPAFEHTELDIALSFTSSIHHYP